MLVLCVDLIPFSNMFVVDGKWANWGSWTKCSQTCEQGVHVRERTCTDPFPNGGKNCVGSGTETAHCFKKPCPGSEVFVAYQEKYIYIYVHFFLVIKTSCFAVSLETPQSELITLLGIIFIRISMFFHQSEVELFVHNALTKRQQMLSTKRQQIC